MTKDSDGKINNVFIKELGFIKRLNIFVRLILENIHMIK